MMIISETVEEHTVDIMEQLISLVEQHPPLYNFQLPLAERSKTIKDMLWKDIYEAMGGCITLQELPKKWKALRDRYLRLKGKKQPSGSGATADHYWKYYKQMDFVDLAAETQETTSSIPPDPTTPTSIPQSSLS
ncbi:unnamed protein product [Phaedon cochleariae]|uniref:MADF domain-containing protein n=1 Tax=Phaedon cochleariae TaxID=80249 RepID=A0A9N9SAG7_PHACE|nr:unnamed protein product [Phaedon cochleariae]